MHELSITQSLLDAMLESVKPLSPPARRILKANVVVGRYRAVVPESLSFAYETLTMGTIAEGSRLEIKTADGRELFLESLEVEQDEH